MISEVDKDGNGDIGFGEFCQLMAMKMKGGEMDEELVEAFKTFDTDMNGYIVEEELRDIMRSYGEKLTDYEVKLMF